MPGEHTEESGPRGPEVKQYEPDLNVDPRINESIKADAVAAARTIIERLNSDPEYAQQELGYPFDLEHVRMALVAICNPSGVIMRNGQDFNQGRVHFLIEGKEGTENHTWQLENPQGTIIDPSSL